MLASEASLLTSEVRGVAALKFISATNKPSIADSELSFENSAFEDHRQSRRWEHAGSTAKRQNKSRGLSLVSSRGRRIVEAEVDEDWFEV